MYSSAVVIQSVIQCVCLSAVIRWNKLDIAVIHRLLSWRATFRCCQMCWPLVALSLLFQVVCAQANHAVRVSTLQVQTFSVLNETHRSCLLVVCQSDGRRVYFNNLLWSVANRKKNGKVRLVDVGACGARPGRRPSCHDANDGPQLLWQLASQSAAAAAARGVILRAKMPLAIEACYTSTSRCRSASIHHVTRSKTSHIVTDESLFSSTNRTIQCSVTVPVRHSCWII